MNFIIRKLNHIGDLTNFIYHYFRHIGLFKLNYNVDTNLKFRHKKQNEYFYKKISQSKLFLEFGSGTTTLLAQTLNKNFISIESDKRFYIYLKRKIESIPKRKKNKSKYLLKSFGVTGFYSRIHFIKWKKYNETFQNKVNKYSSEVFKNLKKIPDLVLVDGRYRLLCLINLYEFLKKKRFSISPTIILDDFSIRKHNYQAINRLYEIKTYYDFALLTPKTKLKNKEMVINEMKKIHLINHA